MQGNDMGKPIAEKDPWELKLDILGFAYGHGLMIHPDKDLDGFCKRTIEDGHCICKNGELYCPCSDALGDCNDKGYCTCRLFITRELYPEALASARKRWGRKKIERERKNEKAKAIYR